MHRVSRLALPLIAAVLLLPAPPAGAVKRQVYKDIRARFEGMAYRLRVDLRPADVATTPNVASSTGIGYARERSPVLFRTLQKVFIARIINGGKQRIEITVYRNADEANLYRALAIPQPALANPNAAGTLALFAQTDSTAIALECKAGKKDPDGQLREIEALLKQVFYVDAEPTREEQEAAVLRNRGASIGALRTLTGLEAEEIRAIIEAGRP